MPLTAPEPLADGHELAEFSCGIASLDEWLKRRALFRDGAGGIMHAADSLGIRGIVVHTISEQAKTCWPALGFGPSPLDPMTNNRQRPGESRPDGSQ